jgi:hypothetical protein
VLISTNIVRDAFNATSGFLPPEAPLLPSSPSEPPWITKPVNYYGEPVFEQGSIELSMSGRTASTSSMLAPEAIRFDSHRACLQKPSRSRHAVIQTASRASFQSSRSSREKR